MNNIPALDHIDSIKPAQVMPTTARHSRLYSIGKLAQTILFRPITTTLNLAYRTIKLLVWVPARSGLYKISGFHAESATYFEREYLKTVKAVRDLLFLPSIAKRIFKDITAKRELFADDLPQLATSDFLKVDYSLTPSSYTSYQHGHKVFETIHPAGISEVVARSDASLNTVMASHFLKEDMLAINFGTPNVASFVTRKKEDGSIDTIQVDAKSLKRADMTYHSTNGKIQSGVFLVPTNVPPEALDRFNQAATNMANQKTSHITCVNSNSRILRDAGFSIEGVNMEDIVFPATLFEHLMFRNVFYTDSLGHKHKVHFKVINTTNRSLEDYFENVDTAVVGTRLRHRRRNADTEEMMEARGAAAKELIAQEKERLSKESPRENASVSDLGLRKMTISVPSYLGDAVARIWGRHTIYEVDLADKKDEIKAAFQELAQKDGSELKLRPFAQKKISKSTWLKKHIFFSGPMIRFLRRHMMGHADTTELNAMALFDHLKSTETEKLNFALFDDENGTRVALAKVHANAGGPKELHRSTADWALSKHALLADRKDVYSSGEIWYDKEKKSFIINNDSGTYEPSLARAQLTAQLAKNIFNAGRLNYDFQVAQAVTQ
jgi:hypothetical protein